MAPPLKNCWMAGRSKSAAGGRGAQGPAVGVRWEHSCKRRSNMPCSQRAAALQTSAALPGRPLHAPRTALDGFKGGRELAQVLALINNRHLQWGLRTRVSVAAWPASVPRPGPPRPAQGLQHPGLHHPPRAPGCYQRAWRCSAPRRCAPACRAERQVALGGLSGVGLGGLAARRLQAHPAPPPTSTPVLRAAADAAAEVTSHALPLLGVVEHGCLRGQAAGGQLWRQGGV